MYRQVDTEMDIESRFQAVVDNLQLIHTKRTSDPDGASTVIDESLQDQMIEAIFGSNAIEKVGSTPRITYRLCQAIFLGETPDVSLIDNRDPEYPAELAHVSELDRPQNEPSIIRGRREIVQHAIAFKYMVQILVVESKPLSEAVLKEAHRILSKFSDQEQNGGQYRTSAEKATWGKRQETDEEYEKRVAIFLKYKPNSQPPERKQAMPIYEATFPRHQSVPYLMTRLVQDFNDDMAEAENKGVLDGMSLAAKYCAAFVNIHPFEDGNGRLCRMLLNSILIKYMGICVDIGARVEEREEWIKLSNQSCKEFDKEERNDVDWKTRTSHCRIGTLIIEKAKAKLDQMLEKMH